MGSGEKGALKRKETKFVDLVRRLERWEKEGAKDTGYYLKSISWHDTITKNKESRMLRKKN